MDCHWEVEQVLCRVMGLTPCQPLSHFFFKYEVTATMQEEMMMITMTTTSSMMKKKSKQNILKNKKKTQIHIHAVFLFIFSHTHTHTGHNEIILIRKRAFRFVEHIATFFISFIIIQILRKETAQPQLPRLSGSRGHCGASGTTRLSVVVDARFGKDIAVLG